MMSDMLTHFASFDDCRRLALLDATIAPEFRAVIEYGQEFARLGTLSFGGKTWMEPILRSARQHWAGVGRSGKYERNLAFVLGGLIHQACDGAMKPILSAAVGVDWNIMQAVMQKTPDAISRQDEQIARTQEVSAYFDAEVFREVYLQGKANPFNQFFMAEVTDAGRAFESVIRAMFQRSLLSAHTLKPDSANMEQWLDNLFERVQPYYLDVDLWVSVYQRPDPAKIEAYGVRTTFYNAEDPSIRLARALQTDRPIDLALRKTVYQDGVSTCGYGEILQLGLRYLRNASAFWRGETETLVAPNYETPPEVAARHAAQAPAQPSA
jgi:hypothetical protein